MSIKWNMKNANEYLENMMTENGIEHNYKIASAKNRTKDYYYLLEKKTGYNIMSWSWDTLNQLMTAIEKDKSRFINAMKNSESSLKEDEMLIA